MAESVVPSGQPSQRTKFAGVVVLWADFQRRLVDENHADKQRSREVILVNFSKYRATIIFCYKSDKYGIRSVL